MEIVEGIRSNCVDEDSLDCALHVSIYIVEGIRNNCVDEDSLANGKFYLQGRGSCIDNDCSVRVITDIVRGFADLNSAPYSYFSAVGLCTPCKYRDSGSYKK